MLIHYLKIAIRNLLKYKTQSAICIVGLAVGFVCFALSALWISYEMTYDTSHRDADRLFLFYEKNILGSSGYTTWSCYPVSGLLKNEFPEVEASCMFNRMKCSVSAENGIPIDTYALEADSCFMDMFGISVLAGNREFLYSDGQVALTPDFARQLFGSAEVLGKKIEMSDREYTVCALVSTVGNHSSLSFGVWAGKDFSRYRDDWSVMIGSIIIRLRDRVTVETFQKKVSDYAGRMSDERAGSLLKEAFFIPLPEFRYAPFNEDRGLELNYLVLFSVVGALVILSSLFNYLALFVSRMRMRRREIELRRVCGASRFRLFGMFAVEYLFLLLIAGLIGMMLIEVLLPVFRRLSSVQGDVYAHSLLYFAGIALFSLLCLVPFVRYKAGGAGGRNLFRRVSVFVQLTVSILFVFCLAVLLKQVTHLRHTNIGWERENVAAFRYLYPDDRIDGIIRSIEQMPEVREMLKKHNTLLAYRMRMSIRVDDWDGKQEADKPFSIEVFPESETFIRFYGIRLVAGEMLKLGEKGQALVNETAAKVLGMHDPIGKKIRLGDGSPVTIVGMIKDFHISPPTVPVNPMIFVGEGQFYNVTVTGVAVKYQEGKWEELERNVNLLMEKEYPEVDYHFISMSDAYDEYLESEYLLMKLLVFVSVICILVSAFGIFSLVTLTCRQRRKEIAVRKVNGATVRDILLIFAKEYFILLTLAALLAFAAGYAVMKRWLEQYVEQTEISIWVFILIYVAAAAVVSVSIASRVWQAARQNPAEVIKENK